jgi:hypothetical protein
MTLAKSLILTAVFLVSPVSLALAQPQPDPLTPARRARILTELILPATLDPTGTRAPIDPISLATIVTEPGATYGKFQLGFKVTETNDFAHVTLTTPATGGQAVQLLGDELASGTKVSFAFSRLIGLSTGTMPGSAAASRAAALSSSTDTRAEVFELARADGFITKPGVVLTGTFDYGRQKFTYRETETGPELKPQLRESNGGSFSAGLLFRHNNTKSTYIGAQYKVANGWKGVDPKSRCTALADSTTLDCADVVIGEPVEQKKKSISIEVRQRLGQTLAWTPKLSYDMAKEAEGKRKLVEVPFYLVTDKEDSTGNLTGGVAVGWREGSGAYAAVFVGPKFKTPGMP